MRTVLPAPSCILKTKVELSPHLPSIGVAMFDKHMTDIDELFKRADLAMYQAKAAGRNTIRFFDLRMQTVINARVELEADLRRSLQTHGFTLHDQRQPDSSGYTLGAEALLRWQRSRSQQVSPSVFIPLAEETGMMLQRGEWVLEAACRELVAWGSRPETAHRRGPAAAQARAHREPAGREYREYDRHHARAQGERDWVETADQRNFLAMHGCRAFQGYLSGRPVTAEQF